MDELLKLREKTILRLVYWTARIGLGLTFVISGIRKLPGVKFTALPVENPVGAYFDCMYETGFYWNFIGYFQIVIGLMALLNRTVITAVILMMPVTINIFLISVSLHMKGTPFITLAMLLGNLLLLFWHYPNYSSIIKRPE